MTGKLGLKYSAISDDFETFSKIATKTADFSVPLLPSESKRMSVSLPDCSRDKKPVAKGLDPS